MIKNRQGILYFKRKDVENGQVGEILAMIQFTPVRVEYLYGDRFEMLGLSQIFPEIEEGMMAPTYDLDIVIKDNKLESVSLKL